ncbi:HEPACAM family member 2 isoform X1 [Alligator mississippiensis]|uniref:HEPACAM family member 2 isoform X1 n=2 Tax=Alligator mississippiensis TaxID=8496 RepID=UPI0009071C8C|nr:HEPACAM family member 2 isoform X1 [Alligator mississippiensis]
MGHDAFMEPFSNSFCELQCKIYFLLLGICSALKLTVPSHTIQGIEGKPLNLAVDYNFNITASEIQIIWLFEGPPTTLKYLLSSVNQSVVPDLEYQQKFTLIPPNASLMINPLHISDEGNYIVKVNVRGNETIAASQKIQVAVDVPVTEPIVHTQPSSGAVEYVGNITLTCTVRKGTRVAYQWMKNGKPIHVSPSYTFSSNNDTLLIVPVVKEDIGNYSCLATNPVSVMESEIITPIIYYGPYGLTVNSDKGLKVGEVFTVDVGEDILFDCSADSNPPNTYSWIQRADNATYVIKYGPHLEIPSGKVTQRTIDYMCCAYNNVTGKRDETHFTVIITSVGLEKLAQKGKSLSSLAVITGISLFLILSMTLLFLWKRYQPYKVIQKKLQSSPDADYRKAQTFSGHENALDDFGIYEFVAFPDATGCSRVSNQPVSDSDFIPRQDINSTVYEVIQHIPEQDHQECD